MLKLYSLSINLLKNRAKNYKKHFLNVSWRTTKGEAVLLPEGGAEIKGIAAIRAGALQDCHGKQHVQVPSIAPK